VENVTAVARIKTVYCIDISFSLHDVNKDLAVVVG
jgi:hypothetical protein